MKKMFVPLAITALCVAGYTAKMDDDRLVEVPDDAVEEMKAHGLIDPDDKKAMAAYIASLEEAVEEGEEEAEPAPKKAPPAKKTKLKIGARQRA